MKIKFFIAMALVFGSVFSLEAKDKKKPAGPGTIVGELDGQVIATGGGRVVLLDSDGSEIWTAKAGNCHDVWKLDNGNVLFADGNVKEINPKTGKTVFSYSPEIKKGGGAYACQRLDNGNTVVGENSTGRILEVDKEGKIIFELKVEPYKTGFHHNLRMVRKLKNGNYLVCHSKAKLVREYTPEGEKLFEVKVNTLAFSAVRLANGNTIVGDLARVVEFDSEGKEVWSLEASDLKGIEVGKICGVNVLPNGNLVLGIYASKQNEKGGSLFEVTRDKKIVWRYYKIKGDRSMMSCQKLDSSGKPISNYR